MFPDPDHIPALVGQHLIGFGIAGSVRVNLGLPELGVRLGWAVMFRTAVPEAAIQEHSDFGAGEYQVSGASYALQRPRPNPIAEPQRVHSGPKRALRARVAALVPPHNRTNGG
jgi:hypothetical protein